MKCCFTGHRPDKLYGYNLYKRQYYQLSSILQKLCENLIEKCGVDGFISGGALGFDTLAFKEVDKLKNKYEIENIIAIPFLNQDCKWLESSKIEYHKCKTKADKIFYVDEIEGYKIKGENIGNYNPAKMQLRNQFMVDNSDYVIACWDGVLSGGTWNCIKYALNNNKRVLHIHPKTLNVEWL